MVLMGYHGIIESFVCTLEFPADNSILKPGVTQCMDHEILPEMQEQPIATAQALVHHDKLAFLSSTIMQMFCL